MLIQEITSQLLTKYRIVIKPGSCVSETLLFSGLCVVQRRSLTVVFLRTLETLPLEMSTPLAEVIRVFEGLVRRAFVLRLGSAAPMVGVAGL